MALIVCPECGKEISDKSTQCIHCGFPLNNSNASQLESNRKYNALLVYYNSENRQQTEKLVLELTGSFLEKCPKYLKKYVSKNEVENIQKLFESVGATVQCEDANSISSLWSDNNSGLRKCPICNKPISSGADACPHCGHSFIKPKEKKSISFWGVVGAIIVAVLIMMFL